MTEQEFEETSKSSNTSAAGNDGGVENTNENSAGNESTSSNIAGGGGSIHRNPLRNDILEFLCQNKEIYFKSQQIDDPELTSNEKKEIANEILEKNRATFLSRFGSYLEAEHLNYFGLDDDDNGMNLDETEEDIEVKILLKNLRKNLARKHANIKNRRYAAMQSLIKENIYFSEKEMMRREPHLYEQLIGQYLTESEKRVRDSYDPKNTTFSKIILDNFDKEQMNELRKKQAEEEQMSDDILSLNSYRDGGGENSSKTSEIGTPPSYRKQWGNFDNESDDTSNISRENKKKIINKNQQQQKFITASEREMLRQEFVGMMYSKFLEGEDKDFDYSKVDNNTDLDDLKQIGQDDEDEYFDKSDDDQDNLNIRNYRDVNRMDDDMESDDDLDVYMKHLSKHPTLKKQMAEDEEEDEDD